MKIVENANMKLIKDKKLLVGADNSGSSLKNVIVAHLRISTTGLAGGLLSAL